MLAAATLATLLSVDARLSFEGLLGTLSLTLIFFLLCDLLLAGWAAAALVDALLVGVTLVLAQGLLAIAQWHWAWYAARVPEYPLFLLSYRLFEVAGHPNTLAALVNLALPFAIFRLARAATARGRAAWGAWLLAAEVVLFFTRSRGGWVAAAAVIAGALGWLLLLRLRASGGRGLPALRRALREGWRAWAVAGAYLLLFALMHALGARVSQSEFTTNAGGLTAARGDFWRVAWTNFLAHPLAGSGPLTFGRVYAAQAAAIRAWLPMHAHSLYIDTLTQAGALGLGALLWALLAGARAFAGGLARASAEARRRVSDDVLPCVCLALGGCLIHSLFDVVTALPTNALVVVALAALGLHAAGVLRHSEGRLARWALAVLLAPLALFAVLLRQSGGQEALEQAIVQANAGRWAEAAQSLDAAVAADPGAAFYYGQRGYAYAVLASPVGAPPVAAARTSALRSYSAALALEPPFTPNLLNAAALLSDAGADAQARALIEQAAARGADWALPALLLADRYAAEGRAAEADALFRQAFAAEARASAMAACARSAACRAASASAEPPRAARALHAEVSALLARGQPQRALDALRAIPQSSADPLPWIDRAAAHVALGQLPQARYALRIASELGAAGHNTAAPAAIVLADYYTALGRPDDALEALEQAAGPIGGGQAYSFYVFRRPTLDGQLAPQLDLLQRTPEDLALWRRLADAYAQRGKASEAARTRAQADALAALLGPQ
jgi:hypothetical protein